MAERALIVGRRQPDYAIGSALDEIERRLGPFAHVLTTDDDGIAALAARWAWGRGIAVTSVPRPADAFGVDAIRARARRLFDLEPDVVLVFDTGKEIEMLLEMARERVLPVWRCVVDRATQWTPRLEWRAED